MHPLSIPFVAMCLLIQPAYGAAGTIAPENVYKPDIKGIMLSGIIKVETIKNFNGNGQSRTFIKFYLDAPITIKDIAMSDDGGDEKGIKSIILIEDDNQKKVTRNGLLRFNNVHVTVKGMLSGGNFGPLMFVSEILSSSPYSIQSAVSTPSVAEQEKPLSPYFKTIKIKDTGLGAISGTLYYPSEGFPPFKVVATNKATNTYYFVETKAASRNIRYRIANLPPGEYNLIAYTKSKEVFPGGFTYSVVQPELSSEAPSTNHALFPIPVKAGQEITNVDPSDFCYNDNERFPVNREIISAIQEEEEAAELRRFKASPAYKQMPSRLIAAGNDLIGKIVTWNSMNSELRHTISPSRAQAIGQRMQAYSQKTYIPAARKFTSVLQEYQRWYGTNKMLELADRNHNLKLLLTREWDYIR